METISAMFTPDNIFGSLAAICMIFGYMPQAITTMRTRYTDGIAMATFCMMGLGVRVANPANGLYIKVVGEKASKVLVK